MPWLLLIIKHILPIFEFCIRHSEGPISRPVTTISSNVHKIAGENLQCVNKHGSKLEYKGMETI